VQTTAAVRRDITEGRPGLPLTLRMRLLNVPACAPISNAAVHVWHCDKDGVYSGYAQPGVDATGETFMRGIQRTGDDGVAEFSTIYPGWYPGRVTHIHFQIYLENNTAVMATATSQLAFPDAITTQVYATSTYANRGANSTVAGVARDAVFADGSVLQIAAVTGDPSVGLLATLDVGITAPG